MMGVVCSGGSGVKAEYKKVPQFYFRYSFIHLTLNISLACCANSDLHRKKNQIPDTPKFRKAVQGVRALNELTRF